MVDASITQVSGSVRRSPRQIHPWPGDGPASSAVWLDHSGILTQPDNQLHEHRLSTVIAPHAVLSGHGHLVTSRQDLALAAGDLFCLLPGERYAYHGSADDPWRLHWLILRGPGAAAWAAACGFALGQARIRPSDPVAVGNRWQDIHQACGRQGPGDDLRIVADLYALAALLTSGRGDTDQLPPVRDLLADADRTLAVLGLDCAPAELAQALGVSPSTLLRVCRKAGHGNTSGYLARRRLERAESLLASSDLKVAAVARAVGFADEKYFHRWFRRWRGMTPSVFRHRPVRADWS